MAVHEIEGRYQYTKPVRVIKRDEAKAKHLENHLDSILHLLIEANLERAEFIIKRIRESKQAA